MKTRLLVGIALSAVLSSAAFGAEANYKIVSRIKVSDGGFDYATFDAATGRVLMARTDFTTVIDAKTGAVSRLNSASRAHIALPVPGTNLLALARREGDILIVDKTTDTALGTVPGEKNPDGAAYDPSSKLVFAMNHDSGEATVVDPVSRKSVATFRSAERWNFPPQMGQERCSSTSPRRRTSQSLTSKAEWSPHTTSSTAAAARQVWPMHPSRSC
jgi:DNA-binding beta-propeller fold protein YncE